MSSELRVDKIIPTGGAPSGSGILGGGGVIQVVSMDLVSTAATTSTSYVDVTNFNLTITPKFSTSKFLVTYHVTVGHNTQTQNTVQLVRQVGGSDTVINPVAYNQGTSI